MPIFQNKLNSERRIETGGPLWSILAPGKRIQEVILQINATIREFIGYFKN